MCVCTEHKKKHNGKQSSKRCLYQCMKAAIGLWFAARPWCTEWNRVDLARVHEQPPGLCVPPAAVPCFWTEALGLSSCALSSPVSCGTLQTRHRNSWLMGDLQEGERGRLNS